MVYLHVGINGVSKTFVSSVQFSIMFSCFTMAFLFRWFNPLKDANGNVVELNG